MAKFVDWYEGPTEVEQEKLYSPVIELCVKTYNHIAGQQNGGVVVVNPQALRIALSRAWCEGYAEAEKLFRV